MSQSSAISAVSLPAVSFLEQDSPEASEPSLSAASTSAPEDLPPAKVSQPQPIQPAQAVQPVEQLIEQPVQPQADQQTASTEPLPSLLSQLSQPAESTSTETDSLSTPTFNSPIGADLEHDKVMLLGEEFPHLAGAQSGCYGLESCHQISGNYRRAAQQLIDQMAAQGYQLTERDDIDNTGHRVFEAITLNEPEKTYYLNVFSPDVGSTVYVLSVDILSLEELQQLSS